MLPITDPANCGCACYADGRMTSVRAEEVGTEMTPGYAPLLSAATAEGAEVDDEMPTGGGAEDAPKRIRCRLTKSWKVGLGVLLVVCIVAGVVLGAIHSKLTPNGTSEDNAQTAALYNKIQQTTTADGTSQLNYAVLGSTWTTVHTSVGLQHDDSWAIRNTNLQYVLGKVDQDNGHDHVKMTGQTTMFSQAMDVSADMHYHAGTLKMLVTATPSTTSCMCVFVTLCVLPLSMMWVLSFHVAGPTVPQALMDLVPGGIPSSYSDIWVTDVHLLVASGNVTNPDTGQPVTDGLSLLCHTDVTNETLQNAALLMFNQFVQGMSSIPGVVANQLATLVGTLIPMVHLNASTDPGKGYYLDSWVHFENLTVDITPALETVVASGVRCLSSCVWTTIVNGIHSFRSWWSRRLTLTLSKSSWMVWLTLRSSFLL